MKKYLLLALCLSSFIIKSEWTFDTIIERFEYQPITRSLYDEINYWTAYSDLDAAYIKLDTIYHHLAILENQEWTIFSLFEKNNKLQEIQCFLKQAEIGKAVISIKRSASLKHSLYDNMIQYGTYAGFFTAGVVCTAAYFGFKQAVAKTA